MEHRVLLVRERNCVFVEHGERNRCHELFGKEVPAGEFADDLRNGISGLGQLDQSHSRAIACAHMTLFYSRSIICQGSYGTA